MAGLVIGSSTSFVGEGRVGEAGGGGGGGAALTVLATTVAHGDDFVGIASFDPVAGTDRRWLIFIAHQSDNAGSYSPALQFDSATVSPGEIVDARATINDGSFPYGTIQLHVWEADETFIAAHEAAAFFSISNVGTRCTVIIVELENAASIDVAEAATADAVTSIATAITTTAAGIQTPGWSFAASRVAHSLVAVVDSAGDTWVVDGVARDENADTTPDAGQTELADAAHTTSGATLRTAVSWMPAATGTGLSADGTLAAAAWSALDGSAVRQSPLVASGTLAASTWSALDASAVLGTPLAASGTVASAAWSALDATVSSTASVSSGTVAVASWSALDASAAVSPTVASGEIAASSWSALDAAAAITGASVVSSGTIAEATWSAPDGSAALQSALVASGVIAASTWSSLDASAVLGTPLAASGAVAASAWSSLDASGALQAARVAAGELAPATWSARDASAALAATGPPQGQVVSMLPRPLRARRRAMAAIPLDRAEEPAVASDDAAPARTAARRARPAVSVITGAAAVYLISMQPASVEYP